MTPDELDYDQFKLSDDGKTRYWVDGDKEIRLTAKQGTVSFLSLGSLANKYDKVVGRGGTQGHTTVPESPQLQKWHCSDLTEGKTGFILLSG